LNVLLILGEDFEVVLGGDSVLGIDSGHLESRLGVITYVGEAIKANFGGKRFGRS